MKRLLTTTAIVLAAGGFPFAAQAQDSGSMEADAIANCAMEWNEIDADGNGTVSMEEAKASLDASFQRIDVDMNDEISRQEYRDCFVRSVDNSQWLERRAQDFDVADFDADGEISVNEFRAQAEKSYDKLQQETAGSSGDRAWLTHYVWLTPEQVADSEFLKTMGKAEFAGRSAHTFRALDRDGDETLTRDEWTDRSSPSGMNQQNADARFDDLDTDSSDALTREEYSAQGAMTTDDTTTASIEEGEENSANEGSGEAAFPQGREVPVFLYVYEIY